MATNKKVLSAARRRDAPHEARSLLSLTQDFYLNYIKQKLFSSSGLCKIRFNPPIHGEDLNKAEAINNRGIETRFTEFRRMQNLLKEAGLAPLRYEFSGFVRAFFPRITQQATQQATQQDSPKQRYVTR